MKKYHLILETEKPNDIGQNTWFPDQSHSKYFVWQIKNSHGMPCKKVGTQKVGALLPISKDQNAQEVTSLDKMKFPETALVDTVVLSESIDRP